MTHIKRIAEAMHSKGVEFDWFTKPYCELTDLSQEKYDLLAQAALTAIEPEIKAMVEALEHIKLVTGTADGWPDGETFYKDTIKEALETSAEALANLPKEWKS